MSNVKQLTQSFRAIPPEKFRKKLGRTVFGIGLIVLALRFGPQIKALTGAYADRVIAGMLIVGAVMASFEFLAAPFLFGIAQAKDIAAIVRGKNGDAS